MVVILGWLWAMYFIRSLKWLISLGEADHKCWYLAYLEFSSANFVTECYFEVWSRNVASGMVYDVGQILA